MAQYGLTEIAPWLARLELSPMDYRPLCSCVVALLCMTSPGLFPQAAEALEIAPLRYAVNAAPDAFVPYQASHSLTEANRDIRRILVSIHSSGFDALQYYDNAREAASRVPDALEQTLIVAPQFFQQSVIPGDIPPGLLFWRVSPFRGSGRGAIGPDVKHVGLSAFAVLDEWLKELSDRKRFPQLEAIVLVGHSGGGQLVQRYAMVGKFKPPANVDIRFVVSAPSSYAYPSGERYHGGRRRFIMPDAETIKNCPGYNSWGYGLDAPYGYFAKEDLGAIARDYEHKHVFYLCGSKDNNPNDASIGKSCGAMMQGQHRLQRMQVFSGFLEFKYGNDAMKNHQFAIVRGMGHYGRGNMASAAGLQALFGPLK